MTGLLALLMIGSPVVLLDVAAVLWGTDSREPLNSPEWGKSWHGLLDRRFHKSH